MPSINLRQLRDTRQLKAWLRAGQTVELRERNEVIARIVPEPERPRRPLPDYEERLKAIFGERLLPGSARLEEEREDRF